MKKILTTAILAALALPGALTLSAEDPYYLPVVERNGRKCYYYAANRGENVNGITAKFGWDTKTFITFNPGVSETTNGQVVYYPCEVLEIPAVNLNKASTPEKTAADITALKPKEKPTPGIANKALDLKEEFYIVKKNQNIVDVARANRMSVLQLMTTNPGLTPQNLEEGTVLKVIPGADMMKAELRDVVEKKQKSKKNYKVKKKDTWLSIALKNKIDTMQLMQANPGVRQLEKGKKIIIPQFKDTLVTKWMPVIDPRESTPEGIREIYAQTHNRIKTDSVSKENAKLDVAVLVGCDDAAGRRRDLEFLKGFMLGMQGQSGSGVSVNIKGIDIADYGNLAKTLSSGELDNAGIIICSVDKDFPQELIEYCNQHDIVLFNVFDAKTDISTLSKSGVQVLPPSTYFYDRTSDFLNRIMSDRIFLFVDADNNDPESMCGAMRTRLENSDPSRIVDLTDARELADFNFNPTKSYIVISDAGNKGEISATLSALEKIVDESPNMPLSIVGRATWIVYSNSLEKLFRKLDTYIPSRFIYDNDSQEAKDFAVRYKSFYNSSPLSSLPMYSVMGYDIAEYFINQYIKNSGDLNKAEPASGQLQIEFRPDREFMYNGLVNKRVYLLHFTPFATTEKISL
ncbi:MAG: LysM peptidoglycan-binding domain-containing protein [Prevotella sp.]|nr:LysM peptidoglycan-binding domain-containing protein [Prevotella sp.]MCM1075614.1 LysM peptidoglycan-binding domain-containing protein [Ruminococcus sp.]